MSVMSEIAQEVLQAMQGGAAVVTATVVESSLPEIQPGAKMLVRSDGSVLGGLDGGDIERTVVQHCIEAIPRHAVETIRVTAAGAIAGDRHASAAVEVMIEVIEAPVRLVVVGGGHIGRSLIRMGAEVGFSCTVIDDRPDYANRERFPEADHVVCADFELALAELPVDQNTYVVLVTRGHKQDETSLRCLVGRPAAYLGMIGSKRRTGAVLQHLEDDGFDRDALARVRTPIGLDIGAETPEEIAVSILAEIIMTRRGGTGRTMYYRRGMKSLTELAAEAL
jgi:xanthine dehydrogenase accessory factor